MAQNVGGRGIELSPEGEGIFSGGGGFSFFSGFGPRPLRAIGSLFSVDRHFEGGGRQGRAASNTGPAAVGWDAFCGGASWIGRVYRDKKKRWLHPVQLSPAIQGPWEQFGGNSMLSLEEYQGGAKHAGAGALRTQAKISFGGTRGPGRHLRTIWRGFSLVLYGRNDPQLHGATLIGQRKRAYRCSLNPDPRNALQVLTWLGC